MTPSASSKDRAGSRRLLALLLALLVASVSLFFSMWFARDEQQRGYVRSDQWIRHEPTNVNGPIEVVSEIPNAVLPPSAKAANDAQDAPISENGAPPHQYVRIRFINPGGAVPGEIHVNASLAAGERNLGGRYVAADSTALLQLRLPPTADSLQLRSNDKTYYFEERSFALTGTLHDFNVEVASLVAAHFTAHYDDGVPFSGEATLWNPSGGETMPSQHTAEGHWLSGGDTLRFVEGQSSATGLRQVDCKIRFRSTRAGYGIHMDNIFAADVYEGARLSFVIKKPASYQLGRLVIDFGDQKWQRGESWSYHVVSITRPPFGQNSQSFTPPKDNQLVINMLLEGQYRVSVTHKDLAWQAVVEIKADQDTNVRATLASACRVRVTILDQQGNPLRGAVVMASHGEYATFPAVARPGATGVSDSNGIAVLEGLTSTSDSIVAAADGYEPETLRVVLNFGAVVDAGVVRLVPAEGRVTVRILNARPGADYSAMLMHPLGQGGRTPPRPISSSAEVTFEGLPLREYLIGVHPTKGGKVVSARVTLSSTQRGVVVELDVASIPADPE